MTHSRAPRFIGDGKAHPLAKERARLARLRVRAASSGGEAFAAALCDQVEESSTLRRIHAASTSATIKPAAERAATEAVFKAAIDLHNAIWSAPSEARRNLFLGRLPLLTGLDDHLQELLVLSHQHFHQLPATKPPDYLHLAIVVKLRATFADHGVDFTASASTDYGSTSLAVDAVAAALDIGVVAARKRIERLGTDS